MKTAIYKYILLTGKVLGALTIITTSFFGVYKFFQKSVIEDYTSKSDIEMIKENQIVILDSIASISNQVHPLKVLPEKMEDMKGAVNGMRSVLLDHISKDPAMTIEQFKQYMEASPEVKKNSILRGSEQ